MCISIQSEGGKTEVSKDVLLRSDIDIHLRPLHRGTRYVVSTNGLGGYDWQTFTYIVRAVKGGLVFNAFGREGHERWGRSIQQTSCRGVRVASNVWSEGVSGCKVQANDRVPAPQSEGHIRGPIMVTGVRKRAIAPMASGPSTGASCAPKRCRPHIDLQVGRQLISHSICRCNDGQAMLRSSAEPARIEASSNRFRATGHLLLHKSTFYGHGYHDGHVRHINMYS